MSESHSTSDADHKFERGDVFGTLPEYEWTVEHRLLDVDTGEPMYYLKGNEATHASSKTVTEDQLEDVFELLDRDT